MNRNASWPIDKDTPVTDLGDKRIEMLHGHRKRADTTSDRPGRHMNMNRNATWPTEKGGHQQCRAGRQMNKNATWPAEKGGHQQ